MDNEKEKLTVGEYTITRFHGEDYWIEHDSGEGMQIRKADFEQLIAEFYRENF